MNSDFSIEEPEIRTDTNLSPCSPKPVHASSPANIPVLARQMDPVFNDTSTHLNSSEPQNDAQSSVAIPNPSTLAVHEGVSVEGGIQIQDVASTNHPVAVDSANTNTINLQDSSSLLSLFASSTQASPQISASDIGSAPSQTDRPPFLPSAFNPTALSPSNDIQQLGQVASENGTSSKGIGSVDIQALLDNLTARASASSSTAPLSQNSTFAANTAYPKDNHDATSVQFLNSLSPPSGIPASAIPAASVNLPPRPPPLQTPIVQQDYQQGHEDHSYLSNGQGRVAPPYAPPPGASYQPFPSLPPPPQISGAPGTSPGLNGLPPPPAASFLQNTGPLVQHSSIAPGYRQRESMDRPESDLKGDEDIPWGPEVQKLYDSFLHDERNYVTEGQWDRFPLNSRLFIGNLPTEKVTKRDLFHVFHKYGKLAQISIKQAYGFVQFLDADACYRALQDEQGMQVRGRKMHLEISKPQKNTKKGGGDHEGRGGRNRRSRSPDYTRGGNTGGRQGADRYRSGSDRGQHNRGAVAALPRGRDDYRPGRSPSPKGYRDSRGARSPDRHGGRRRSRSRSPYGRNTYRGASPRGTMDDGLPLPRRDPRDVPDVQIILTDQLDRNFIDYVEGAFRHRGVRFNTLKLSPKLSEPAVVRRQIVEGVTAVMKLSRVAQATRKFSLQVFDRSGGVDNVKFEEYSNLDLHICVELVVQKKLVQPSPHQLQYQDPAAYAAAQFGLPAATARPPMPHPGISSGLPNMPNAISTMDSNSLQRLLGQLQSPKPPQHSPTQPPTSGTDLSRLLSGFTSQQSPTYPPPSQSQVSPFSSANLASLLGSGIGSQHPPQVPSQQSQPVPDMQSILAQLGKYKQ